MTHSVLAIALGSSWSTMGSAVIRIENRAWVDCETAVIQWPAYACNPRVIADAILDFAVRQGVCHQSRWPAGWRDPAVPGRFVGRECERITRTPGKTAVFGVAKPRTWLRWIQCCIEAFDLLLENPSQFLQLLPKFRRRRTASPWSWNAFPPRPGAGRGCPRYLGIRSMWRLFVDHTEDLKTAFALQDPPPGPCCGVAGRRNCDWRMPCRGSWLPSQDGGRAGWRSRTQG